MTASAPSTVARRSSRRFLSVVATGRVPRRRSGPAGWPLAACLAIGLTAAAAPAGAVGRLTDVTVVDRDSGATLPVHYHGGRWYVAGRPAARYAIAVRNRTGERVLTVISVDGVNVVSGESAHWMQTGYVLSPQVRYQIAGWRKSDQEVAAFEFTSLADSYAARTGRGANVGVIGVAVFRERLPVPAVPPVGTSPVPSGAARERADAGAAAEAANDTARAESSAAAPSPAAPSPDTRRSYAPPESAIARPKLGTGHGSRESSVVEHTRFDRLRDTPDEVISVYYDSRENLIAMGVIPRPGPVPQPFPVAPVSQGYVPDPPGR